MKNVFSLLFFLLISLFCLSINIIACSCEREAPGQGKPPKTQEEKINEQINKSDFIFVGKVRKIIEIGNKHSVWGYKIVFEILMDFKGVDKKRIVLQMNGNFFCDYEFKKENEYLIYAFKSNLYDLEGKILSEFITTNQCTRTNLLKNASKDIEILNKFYSK
ncbi:MAG: hypothetical protein ACR2J3_05710 [Aridibacter sp.]|nr:hypothetical protein [Acidobacteriota bacterium]